MASQLRPEHARAEATHHRGRAADLIRQAALPDQDGATARDMLHQSDHHVAAAELLENSAQEPVSENEPQVGEPAEHARANEDRARAWYLPGSVAQDPMQSMEEATHGPGILEQGFKYAARSLIDRDGAAYSAVADTASQATKATVSAVGDAAKETAHVTGQALSQGAQALAQAGRGMAQTATTAVTNVKAATTDVKATEVDAHKAQHEEPAKAAQQKEPAKAAQHKEPAKTAQQKEPAKAAPPVNKAQEAKARDLVKRHSPPKPQRQAPAKGRER